MKFIVSTVGLLTLAQWMFILLLHVFLTVQDKRSPETLNKLHDTPIIGGYFPAVETTTDTEKEEAHAQAMRIRLSEAKKFFEMPEAFSTEELKTLSQDIREQKAMLQRVRTQYEEQQAQLGDLIKEVERREAAVNEQTKQLQARTSELEKRELENASMQKTMSKRLSAIEQNNLKRMAKIFNAMQPEKVAEYLNTAPADESKEALERRTETAARILNFMDPAQAGAVFEAMEAIDAVRIRQRMQILPPNAVAGG